MRYTIEATENSCTEIFELRNGKKYIRKHSRTQYGSICNDAMFDDQLEADGVDPDIIDGANDLFGGSMTYENAVKRTIENFEALWNEDYSGDID